MTTVDEPTNTPAAPASHAAMLNLTLRVWRQDGPDSPGEFETYTTTIADDASFLEMLDVVNERLIAENKEPITFESDSAGEPALYYFVSHPAHTEHPTRRVTPAETQTFRIGSAATSSDRTLRR